LQNLLAILAIAFDSTAGIQPVLPVLCRIGVADAHSL